MAVPEDAEHWKCPRCGADRSTPFCAECGERKMRSGDLTIRDLSEQLWGALSSLDAQLLRSLRLLLSRPGALSAAYIRGRRREYLGPLQLFFFANALFFTVQSLTHTNIFSSTLDSHLYHQDWSGLAQSLVKDRLAAHHLTLSAYAPVFNEAVVLNAKSLIILMALSFAALLPIAFLGRRMPLAGHVIFALHLYSFILLLFCVILLALEAEILAGGSGLASRPLDITVSLFNLAVCSAYLHAASRVVYGRQGGVDFVRAGALTIALAAIVLGYRFLIFLITLYTT